MDFERAKESRLCGANRIDCGKTKGAYEHDKTSSRMDRCTRADRVNGDLASGARRFGQPSRLWCRTEEGIKNRKLDHAWNRSVRDLRISHCRGAKLEFGQAHACRVLCMPSALEMQIWR